MLVVFPVRLNQNETLKLESTCITGIWTQLMNNTGDSSLKLPMKTSLKNALALMDLEKATGVLSTTTAPN